MPTRLVAFLGLGPGKEPPHYNEVRYQLQGSEPSRPIPLHAGALLELITGIGSLVVLGTKEVHERWIGSGLFEKHVGRTPHFIELDHGATPEQRWQIFTETTRALSADAIQEAGEIEPPAEILVDVTHGFRAQPLLGMAAVSYVLSEWAREEQRSVPRLRVLYGSYDERDKKKNIAPTWDLTEFVTATRWNSALDALMRFGRADGLEFLGRQEGQARVERAKAAGVTGQALGAEKFPAHLGKAARAFADDMALGRLRDLLTRSAPKLREQLGKPEAQALEKRLPPLRSSLARLREWVDLLCAPNTLGKEGLRATAHLATLLGRLDRFAEQAAVVREGLVTHFALFHLQASLPEPGCKELPPARKEVETRWNELCRANRKRASDDLPEVVRKNVGLSGRTTQDRNDIEHCGLADKPRPAAALRTALEQQASDFSELVIGTQTSLPRVVEHTTPRSSFFNLSNHPLSGWRADQLAVARELGLGEPAELEGGMPLVPAGADTAEVEALAGEVAQRALAQGAAGALVSSDFTFTVSLVRELQARGVRCFSATTERRAEDEPRQDGSVEHRSVFRFVRFREYPRLA